jgi:hypothetical protein
VSDTNRLETIRAVSRQQASTDLRPGGVRVPGRPRRSPIR